MDCVNHSGVNAAAYCQNCGKALCTACVRNAAAGQILCEPCWTAWHSVQQPFVTPYSGGPNPVAAAALGIIPGVGAMYNGQFVKGLIHVFIFAVIVSTTTHIGIFGLFIPAWILYQVFEAYHVAKARRDGQPLPDPLGLNEISNWINFSGRPPHAGQPGAGPNPAGSNPPGQYPSGQAQAGQYQPPYQPPSPDPSWQTPFQGSNPPPPQGYANPGADPGYPPIPPIPPLHWRRKEPIGAVILIGLGLLFLLGQMDFFSGRVFEIAWPLMLIGLGAWLFVRRYQDSQGGPR
ncbi:MAG: B-box zinc finger protein [Terracidiphilus sp.]